MEQTIRCAETGASAFPIHSHKQYEIVCYTDGTGIMTIDDAVYSFCAGTIALIPPGVTHSSVGDGAVRRIFLQGDFTTEIPSTAPLVFQDDNSGDGQLLIRMIHRNRLGNPAYLSALCHAYLQFIAARVQHDDAVHRAVTHVMQTISERCCDSQCDVTTILLESGYAVDYIRSLVKQRVGKTPHALLTEARIQRACFLMETYRNNVPLTQIAEECGYTDYAHFSKTFKSFIGCSPRNFLKSKQ